MAGADPRAVVIGVLARAFDDLAEDEQVAVARGDYDLAMMARTYADRVLRALNAETFDPTPRGPCRCGECTFYRLHSPRAN